MNYGLFLGELFVGEVDVTDEDELAAGGTLRLSSQLQAAARPQEARLLEFIRLNQRCLELTEQSDEDETRPELVRVNAELAGYPDLAESNEWYVASPSGPRRSILCPIFHADGETTWRWTGE